MGAKKFFLQAQEQGKVKLALVKAEEEKEQARLQALEDAKPKPWDTDPFSTLDTLLILALAEKFHPGKGFHEVLSGKPKKFLDVTYRVATCVRQAVYDTVIKPIMADPRPFKKLQERVDTYLTLEAATEEFSEQGYHGVLIYQSVIYPVKLYGEDSEAILWGRENETHVMRMTAHVAATAWGLDGINCHILLFASWGFSGLMTTIGHAVTDIRAAFPDHEDPKAVNS
jgi:hypothetical protein